MKACATGDLARMNKPVLISDTVRITYQDVQNFRRKYRFQEAQLAPDSPSSLEKHRTKIIEEGGNSIYRNNLKSCSNTYLFAFSNSLQISVLEQYSSVLLLDSTHNTCYTIEDTMESSFLYTLVAKHDATGCGVTVAFMLTNSESSRPLVDWLSWLRSSFKLS